MDVCGLVKPLFCVLFFVVSEPKNFYEKERRERSFFVLPGSSDALSSYASSENIFFIILIRSSSTKMKTDALTRYWMYDERSLSSFSPKYRLSSFYPALGLRDIIALTRRDWVLMWSARINLNSNESFAVSTTALLWLKPTKLEQNRADQWKVSSLQLAVPSSHTIHTNWALSRLPFSFDRRKFNWWGAMGDDPD